MEPRLKYWKFSLSKTSTSPLLKKMFSEVFVSPLFKVPSKN